MELEIWMHLWRDELKRLHESTLNLVDPSSVAAIIVEPIQGEGGFNPIPQKYLEGLKGHFAINMESCL